MIITTAYIKAYMEKCAKNVQKKLPQYWQLGRFSSPTGAMLLFWPTLLGVIYSAVYAKTKNLQTSSAPEKCQSLMQQITTNPNDLSQAADSFKDSLLILPSLPRLEPCNNNFLIASVLVLIGAIIMRAAGCAWNDYLDKNIDKLVTRTKNRPLASSAISNKEAFGFIFLLLLGALTIVMQFPLIAFLVGVLCCILAVFYPKAKKILSMPQIVLGLTFNSGIFVTWLSFNYHIPASIYLGYFGLMLWTIAYDTIYAFQDICDDKKNNINSSAIVLSNIRLFSNEPVSPMVWIKIIYSISTIALAMSMYLIANSAHAIISILPIVLLELFIVTKTDLNLPDSCMLSFKINNYLGLLMCLCALSLLWHQ